MDLATNERPKHTATVYDIPDGKLIEGVMRHLTNRGVGRNPVPLWTVVMDVFGLGSTYSMQLCRRFDLDPDKPVRKNT